MTMDDLIAQGYCFFVGRTVVKPDLVFCTIRDVRGETVAQARAMTAADAIAEAIATISKPVLSPRTMPMPAPRTMPGMPQPKGTN